MPERVRVSQVADITGLEPRTIQAMAARGDLPGAGKMGKVWTFDERAIRAWVRRREAESCRTISIGVVGSGGRECKLTGATTDEAYERLFSPKRASA